MDAGSLTNEALRDAGFLATCDPALVSTILKAPHTEQRSRFYKVR